MKVKKSEAIRGIHMLRCPFRCWGIISLLLVGSIQRRAGAADLDDPAIEQFLKSHAWPIHKALRNNDMKMLHALSNLKWEVDVNQLDAAGLAPIHYASAGNMVAALPILLSFPSIHLDVQTNIHQLTPLMLAFKNYNHEIIRQLLHITDKSIGVHAKDADETTALLYAIKFGTVEEFEMFLLHEAAPEWKDLHAADKFGDTALQLLVLNFKEETEFTKLNMLLKRCSPAGWVIHEPKLLFQSLRNSPTALLLWNHIPKTFQEKIVHAKDRNQGTILCHATVMSTDLMQVFLKVPGIDVNFVCPGGQPPLLNLVALLKHEHVAHLLVHPDINVNAINSITGNTALMLAAQRMSWPRTNTEHVLEITRSLLHHPEIDATIPNKFGQTAMEYAILADNARLESLYRNRIMHMYVPSCLHQWHQDSLPSLNQDVHDQLSQSILRLVMPNLNNLQPVSKRQQYLRWSLFQSWKQHGIHAKLVLRQRLPSTETEAQKIDQSKCVYSRDD